MGEGDPVQIENGFKRFTRLKTIQKHTQVITDVKELIDCDAGMFCLHFEFLLKRNPDVTLGVADHILLMRTDLDKNQRRQALEECRVLFDVGQEKRENARKSRTRRRAVTVGIEAAKQGIFAKLDLQVKSDNDDTEVWN